MPTDDIPACAGIDVICAVVFILLLVGAAQAADGSLPEPFCLFVLGFQSGFMAAQPFAGVISSVLRLGAQGGGQRSPGHQSGNNSGITALGITTHFSWEGRA